MNRLLGLDVGEKTIGVAVSDPLGLTAQPVTVIRRVSKEVDFRAIQQIVEQYEVKKFVVGWPRNMDGSIGERAKKSEQFAKQLSTRFQLPAQLWDERLTTAAAQRTLLAADASRAKRKQHIDKLAAVFILQSYMDAHASK